MKEARNVVGSEVIFTCDKLKPNVKTTAGTTMPPMKSRGFIISEGTPISRRLSSKARIAA
jgi:hypothetical protein